MANTFNFIEDESGDPIYCFYSNCLSGGESPISSLLTTVSCNSGFEFDCEQCRCISTGEINNTPLSSFGFQAPSEWQFAVSWEMKDKALSPDIKLPKSTGATNDQTYVQELTAAVSEHAPADSYAALAIARYDSRRKNYKVDIVPGSIVNTSTAAPWGSEKVFEGLRLSTDVFYNQPAVELLHSSQTGGAVNINIEYIKFWFNGELPVQIVDKRFTDWHTHLNAPWSDVSRTPLNDRVERQSEINAVLRWKAKVYDWAIRTRKFYGFGVLPSPSTRTDSVSSINDYLNESLIYHGWNSTQRNENAAAVKNSIKLFTRDNARDVKLYRNAPMDAGVINFEDGYIRRDQFGRFITSVAQDSFRNNYPFAEGRTKFIPNGDRYLSSDLSDEVITLLEPGGLLSSYGPGTAIDIDKTWSETVKVPKSVWTEVDTLYTPIYTVLSAISSSYWPTSAPEGSLTESYVDYLNLLYPEEIPAGEIIEPAYALLILSSYPALSANLRINTPLDENSNPWWNPSLLTHVSFVSGGKIKGRHVISLAYNKIDLNEGADIGNTTLLSYGKTLIEVNNAYNGAVMGLVLDDYEVKPFIVDIDNPEITLEPGFISGITDEAEAARLLGII